MDTGTMLTSTLVPISVFAMVVLIVWLAHLAKRSKLREQAELQKHFLNKFNSAQELTQFLDTPEGQSFLKDLRIGGDAGGPKERIIRSIKSSLLLLALGAGFLVLLRIEKDLIYPAVLLLALGIGFLISAAVSYWLSKKWNIFEEGDIRLDKRADSKM
jgi:hypothetical protein